MIASRQNIFYTSSIAILSLVILVFSFGLFSFSYIPSVHAATCDQNTTGFPGVCRPAATGCPNRATESPDNTFTCGAGQLCCIQIGPTLRDCASFPTAQLITASSCPSTLPIQENTGDAVGGKICCRPDPATFVQSCGTNNDGTCVAPGTCSGRVTSGNCPGSADTTKTACCVPSTVTNSCTSPNSCLDTCGSGQSPVSGKICTGVAAGKTCCTPVVSSLPATCGVAGKPACCAGVTPPAPCSGTPAPSSPQTISFKNPLKFDTVEGVLGSLLGALQGIIVVLALVFIVIGAVLYITSAGNDSRMTLAKGAITAAMIGLAIGIAAPSFLKEIGTILGWTDTTGAIPSTTLTLSAIALNVLNFLLSIVGVLGIIMLVVGGIVYLTASGDEERIGTGKKIVTYAIIGISVALAALIIVSQIAALFV